MCIHISEVHFCLTLILQACVSARILLGNWKSVYKLTNTLHYRKPNLLVFLMLLVYNILATWFVFMQDLRQIWMSMFQLVCCQGRFRGIMLDLFPSLCIYRVTNGYRSELLTKHTLCTLHFLCLTHLFKSYSSPQVVLQICCFGDDGGKAMLRPLSTGSGCPWCSWTQPLPAPSFASA